MMIKWSTQFGDNDPHQLPPKLSMNPWRLSSVAFTVLFWGAVAWWIFG